MSNPAKSEIKAAAAQEIGIRIDDLLDEATRELYQAGGAQTAFVESAKAVAKLFEHVNKDLDLELYPLDVGAKIKLYITRAVTLLENLGHQSNNLQIAAHGRKQALSKVITTIKTYQDSEKNKIPAPLPVEELTVKDSLITVEDRPKPTIKERRLAEERELAPVVPLKKPRKATKK